jgi:hypothetical protein
MRSERAQRFDRLTAGKTAPLQSFQRLERERYGFSRHWKISRDFFRGLEKAAACPQGLMVTTKVGKSALTGALPTAQGRICVVGSATTEEKNSSLDPRPSPLAPRPSTLAPRHSPLVPRHSPLAPRPSTLVPSRLLAQGTQTASRAAVDHTLWRKVMRPRVRS